MKLVLEHVDLRASQLADAVRLALVRRDVWGADVNDPLLLNLDDILFQAKRLRAICEKALGREPSRNAERDAEIVRRYVSGGETLREIAAAYGLSHQRVVQIAHTAGHYGKTNPQRELAAYRRIAEAVAIVARAESKPGARHGTRARYDRGCHCRRCRKANADYHRERQRAARRAAGVPERGSTTSGEDAKLLA